MDLKYDARAELRNVLDAVGDAIVVTDRSGRTLNVNATCVTLFGFPGHELIGQPVARMFVPRGERKVLASVRAAFAQPSHAMWDPFGRRAMWEHRLLARHKDGRTIIVDAKVSRFLQNGLTRYVLVMRDDSIRRRSERALARAALRDPLTGLINRTAFGGELRNSIERARRSGAGFALLLLDLDRFKEINDSAGHQVGDLMLRQVARRLREQMRQSDILARLGGDEFAVIIDAFDGAIDAVALAERLVAALARPFRVAGIEAYVNASIGISMFPRDTSGADQLLACADLAMYAAKAGGGAGWRLFDSELQEAVSARTILEAELRSTLRDSQLKLLYQPLVRTSDLTVCGFEALLRWNHPNRGVLGPEAFISLAERSRLIQPITEWVLNQAIEDASTLPAAPGSLTLAVNISTGLFEQDDLVDIVARASARARKRTRLILEITEGALADYEHASVTLNRLRQLGIEVAIDDFGTGYSSLGRLKGLPLDVLKIDRSFISSLPSSAADRAIIDAVVRLAKSLGIATVAEGVETLDHLLDVAHLGCSQGQGYLFAAPMTIEHAADWLEQWPRWELPRLRERCGLGAHRPGSDVPVHA